MSSSYAVSNSRSMVGGLMKWRPIEIRGATSFEGASLVHSSCRLGEVNVVTMYMMGDSCLGIT